MTTAVTRRTFAEAPVAVGGLWLVPVCATTVRRASGRHGGSAYLSVTPEVLVVVGHDGARAFALDGSDRDMARLMDEIPGLRAIVASLMT